MNWFTRHRANEKTRSECMKWIFGMKVVSLVGGALGMLLLVPGAAGGHKAHPYRYSVVDVPVSLTLGTVRTPAFPVASNWYWIMIQVEKPLPFQKMVCMMGVTPGLFDPKDCSGNDTLLQADWTVWDGQHMVDHGSSKTSRGDLFTNKYIFKTIGSFAGEAGKKYVLEVKFTRDGTPLNVANPHLIVIKQGDE